VQLIPKKISTWDQTFVLMDEHIIIIRKINKSTAGYHSDQAQAWSLLMVYTKKSRLHHNLSIYLYKFIKNTLGILCFAI